MTTFKTQKASAPLLIISLFIFSCASQKTEEASADSTATTIIVDTLKQQTPVAKVEEEDIDVKLTEAVEFDERQSFPIRSVYSNIIYSDSSTEQSIQTKLDSLIDTYDALTLTTLESNSEVSYEVGNDYDDGKETETMSEQKIWWYDSLMHLRAYANVFKDAINDRTTLYLFENGKITGYYSDALSGGQDTQEFKERGVAFNAPNCVIKMEIPYGAKPYGRYFTVYDENYLEDIYTAFISDYRDLVKELRAKQLSRRKDGDYEYDLNDNFAGNYFVVTYSATEPVQKYLLNK